MVSRGRLSQGQRRPGEPAPPILQPRRMHKRTVVPYALSRTLSTSYLQSQGQGEGIYGLVTMLNNKLDWVHMVTACMVRDCHQPDLWIAYGLKSLSGCFGCQEVAEYVWHVS